MDIPCSFTSVLNWTLHRTGLLSEDEVVVVEVHCVYGVEGVWCESVPMDRLISQARFLPERLQASTDCRNTPGPPDNDNPWARSNKHLMTWVQ